MTPSMQGEAFGPTGTFEVGLEVVVPRSMSMNEPVG